MALGEVGREGRRAQGSSACKSQGVAVTLEASRENVTQTDPLPRFHGEALYQRL